MRLLLSRSIIKSSSLVSMVSLEGVFSHRSKSVLTSVMCIVVPPISGLAALVVRCTPGGGRGMFSQALAVPRVVARVDVDVDGICTKYNSGLEGPISGLEGPGSPSGWRVGAAGVSDLVGLTMQVGTSTTSSPCTWG